MSGTNKKILLALLIAFASLNLILLGIYFYHKVNLLFSNHPDSTKAPNYDPTTKTISLLKLTPQKNGNPFKEPSLVGKNETVALYIFEAIILEIVPGNDTTLLYVQKPTGEVITEPLLVRNTVKPIISTNTATNVSPKEVNLTALKKNDRVQISYNIDELAKTGEVTSITIYK